jgi:hypothetical protein
MLEVSGTASWLSQFQTPSLQTAQISILISFSDVVEVDQQWYLVEEEKRKTRSSPKHSTSKICALLGALNGFCKKVG